MPGGCAAPERLPLAERSTPSKMRRTTPPGRGAGPLSFHERKRRAGLRFTSGPTHAAPEREAQHQQESSKREQTGAVDGWRRAWSFRVTKRHDAGGKLRNHRHRALEWSTLTVAKGVSCRLSMEIRSWPFVA